MKLSNLLLAMPALIVLVGGYVFRQEIYDQYRLRSYTPTSDVEAYVQRAGLSDHGREIFFIGHPQVNNSDEFNQNCQFSELSIVLGCYTTPDIFILDITEQQLDGIEEVTAAHEMLHVAYERLEGQKKQDVDQMLQRQFELIDNERVVNTLATYSATSTYNGAPAYNEMHSIFATEIRTLTEDLERYFSQYFTDRTKVVSLSENYEMVFTDLQDEIDSIKDQIDELAVTINTIESELGGRRAELNRASTELNTLQSSGNVSQYNERVPFYNADVADFNVVLNDYRATIDRHNELVKEVNDIVLQKRSLQKSLDSKFTEESISQ